LKVAKFSKGGYGFASIGLILMMGSLTHLAAQRVGLSFVLVRPTEMEIDQIDKTLEAVNITLWASDSDRTATGTRCQIDFFRNGELTRATGPSSVSALKDYDALDRIPGNVKIVEEIRVCGTFTADNGRQVPRRGDFSGCAGPSRPPKIVVRREMDPVVGAGVLGHEFGHTRGYPNSNLHGDLMFFGGALYFNVTPTQCNCLSRGVSCPVPQPQSQR
jgi:hypothetical protein